MARFSREKLRDMRLQRGLTQRDIPGVEQTTVWAIEAGRQDPRPSTLRKLAAVLDVEVAAFFDEPTVPLAKASTEPPPPSRTWLLERTEGRHAYLAMAEDEARGVIDELSLEGLRDIKEDIDLERSLIEYEFERELGHPVHVRKALEDALFEGLKVAWLNYGVWLQDIDRRRRLLREHRDSAGEARLVAV